MKSISKPYNVDSASAGGDTPLLDPKVVVKIKEHLNPSFQELKTFRLVCKVWNEVTLHHWRNSCAVLTLLPEHLSIFTQPQHKSGLPISEFSREFKDTQSPFQLSVKPFSKYKFKGLTFDMRECNKAGGPAQAFWNTFGPLIKSLCFENCIFMKPVPVKTVTCPMTQLLIGYMPNVKDLILNVVETKEYLTKQGFQVFAEKPHLNLRSLTVNGGERQDMNLTHLLKISVNLKEIIGLDRPNSRMSRAVLLEPVYQVRYTSKMDGYPAPLSNLKNLDLINSCTFLYAGHALESVIAVNMKKAENIPQLPLESLAIHLVAASSNLNSYGDPDAAGSLAKYLKSFSGSLKTLKLLRFPEGQACCNFLGGAPVEMSMLTELTLWGNITPDFGFLKNTPKLERLTVDLGCISKRDRSRNSNHAYRVGYRKYEEDLVLKVPSDLRIAILCPDLEDLEIDFEFPEESLRLLGKWMPKLRILKTILNLETVPVVCEVWRELTQLVCLPGSKIQNSCFIREEERASGSPSAKLKICDLKELERFQLDTYCGESSLTDDAVFNGFLNMSGLKRVDICVNKQMTAAAAEALRKGIQFCKVIRNEPMVKVVAGAASSMNDCECERCKFRREVEKG